MSFEDPLAGILSDGSDDSFFDDDILGKKKSLKTKNILSNSEKKNSLFDLEGDKPNESQLTETKKDSIFDLDKKKSEELKLNLSSPGPTKRSLPKDSFKLQPSNSIKSPAKIKGTLSTDKFNYSQEPKKDTDKILEKSKSSLLLDDILGPQKKPSSSHAKPVTAASSNFNLDSYLEKETSKTEIKKNSAPKQNKGKGDGGLSKKKPSDDWLGLFQDTADDIKDNADMPAWLVGDVKRQNVKENNKNHEKPEEINRNSYIEEHRSQNETQKEAELAQNVENIQPKQSVNVPSSNIPLDRSADITTEGATMYFQQQEAQLMVAMQLKAQEEKLAAMQLRQKERQRVQREAALAHHSQLDAMLKKQMENRHQMQSIIAAHQERITQRIKALLSTEDSSLADGINNAAEELAYPALEKKESPYSKERRQLLQLVQSLQENHDKEIDLMETSYRRQLAFLEVSLNQSEERMKEESNKVVRFYSEKINWLEEHHLLYKKMTVENLNSLTERHKAENETLRQQHLQNITILQEHHCMLMENIKDTVKREQILLQDSAGFSNELHELVTDVRENKSQCQTLVDKVESLVSLTQDNVAKSLEKREAHINDMTQQLKRERDYFETEKTENREMVKMLETRLKQMTHMIEEERATLKQKRMELEFEKATFNKETEFTKSTLKKQEEEIKIIKKDVETEYQDKINIIDEDRKRLLKDSTIVAKEKATVLSLKEEMEKMKFELQVKLEQVNEERSKLNVERQQLNMEEQKSLAKSRDLNLLAKSAMEKQEQADKKCSEAESIERKYEERIRQIQEHIVSLNSREKQIAKEKVILSRERLALHNERKQIESRQQCSLCKSTSNIPNSFEPGFTIPESLSMPVSRDYGDIPVNSAMSAIEQEMAHLMGRNFNLRHNIGSIRKYDNRGYNKNEGDTVPNMMNSLQTHSDSFQDYRDPKFMMLRLDVQKVLSNIEPSVDGHERTEHIDNRQ